MAPAALEVQDQGQLLVATKSVHREPLQLSKALDEYENFDITPIIGREFPKANLSDWLNAPNADELIRDLAITSENVSPSKMRSLRTDELQSHNAASSSSARRIT
jgi:hypothetical protein